VKPSRRARREISSPDTAHGIGTPFAVARALEEAPMRCEKIMKEDVITVAPNDSTQRAAYVMREQNVGFLPVCDPDGRVVGVITDRDLAIRVCAEAGDASEIAVADVMTNEVVACTPDDEITHAERLMARYRKSRILVVDLRGRLLGVISLSDVVARDSNKHAARTLRKIVGREIRP
jgi:CBS domain-containing protein